MTKTSKMLSLAILTLLCCTGCRVEITSIEQPLEIEPGALFTTLMHVSWSDIDHTDHLGLTIVLPEGWLIPDTLPFMIDTLGMFIGQIWEPDHLPDGYYQWSGYSDWRPDTIQYGPATLEIPISAGFDTGPHYISYGLEGGCSAGYGDFEHWSRNNFIWTGELELLAADLYVDPAGSDTNSGLSADEPLQTISCAMAKIQANSENARTIHLAPGIYSSRSGSIDSTTSRWEHYPVLMKSYVSIVGAQKESVWPESGHAERIFDIRDARGCEISEVTLVLAGGRRTNVLEKGGGIRIDSSEVSLHDIHIERVSANVGAAIFIENSFGENTVHVSRISVDPQNLHNETIFSLEKSDATINWSSSSTPVYLGSGSNLTMNHCTLYSEESDLFQRGDTTGIMLNVTNSILWGPMDSLWVDSMNISYSDCAIPVEGEGNISEDPEFCYREEGDLSLFSESCCVGAASDGGNMGALDVGCGIVEIDQDGLLPDKFMLCQNYPNPFNPETTIPYTLPMASQVTVKILDLLGREVVILVDSNQLAGSYRLMWDGHDNFGNPVATGVYFCQIQSGAYLKTIKMVYLK